MAGNRHNECNSGIISTLKTYHTISLFQFSLILLLAYICAVLFIVMGMHMVFRSDHSGQRTQPDCLNVLHVCKPALACYTVTSGRTNPESWPRVESTDLLKPCQAEGMRWFLRVCVCVCAMGLKCEVKWFCWFSASWLRSKSSQTCVNEISKESNGVKRPGWWFVGDVCASVSHTHNHTYGSKRILNLTSLFLVIMVIIINNDI